MLQILLIYGLVRAVHFRRYISKKILAKVLSSCPNLEQISLSKSASRRLSKEMIKELYSRCISILVFSNKGRKPKFASVAQLGRAADLYISKISAGSGFDSQPRLSIDCKGGDKNA